MKPVRYQLTFERKPRYLHATVTGTNTRENVMGYLDEVRRECEASGCTRVLIEERLVGPRMDMVSILEIVTQSGKDAVGLFEAIAYVDVIAQGHTKFAETVAVNRGLPVAVFGTVADAEQWLLGEHR
jgi:hypothetical protein